MKLFVILVLSAASLSFGAKPAKVLLEMSLVRSGKTICTDSIEAEAGKSYLWCKGVFGADSIHAQVQIEPMANSVLWIKSHIDQIAPSGKIANLSNPTIQTVYNERAEVTVSESTGENIVSFAVTARLQ